MSMAKDVLTLTMLGKTGKVMRRTKDGPDVPSHAIENQICPHSHHHGTQQSLLDSQITEGTQTKTESNAYLGQLLTHYSIKLALTDTVTVDNEPLGPLLGVAVELLQQLLHHALEVLQHIPRHACFPFVH